MELREIDVAGLHGDGIEAPAEHSGVALVGDRTDQQTAQAEEAGLRQLLHDLAGHQWGAR